MKFKRTGKSEENMRKMDIKKHEEDGYQET